MAKLTHAELVEVIGEKTLHTTDSKKLAQEIAAFMVHENHMVDLDTLARDVMQYRQDRGFIEATAVSAHELPQAVIDDVRSLLKDQFPEAKNITVDSRIDPNVIGGVRIELPRQRLDMTVQSKINTFKRLTTAER